MTTQAALFHAYGPASWRTHVLISPGVHLLHCVTLLPPHWLCPGELLSAPTISLYSQERKRQLCMYAAHVPGAITFCAPVPQCQALLTRALTCPGVYLPIAR
jgi:hypothetical protein